MNETTSEPIILEDDLDADIFRDLGTHQLAECTFIGVDIDQPFVHPHLPPVPGGGPFPVGAFPYGHHQAFGGEWNGSGDVDTGPLCDLPYPVADHLNLLEIGPCEAYPGLLHDIHQINIVGFGVISSAWAG